MSASVAALAQEDLSSRDRITRFTYHLFFKVQEKTAYLEARRERQTGTYVHRLLKKEKILLNRSRKTDYAVAIVLLANAEQQYAIVAGELKDATDDSGRSGEYIPYVDRLKTSRSFLQKHSSLLTYSKNVEQEIQGIVKQVRQLQSKLVLTGPVKALISLSKGQIRKILNRYSTLPQSIRNTYNDCERGFYYFSQQMKVYRLLLNNPDQLTQNALLILDRIDAFQRSMLGRSQLTGLFGVPSGYHMPQTVTILETRAQVQQ